MRVFLLFKSCLRNSTFLQQYFIDWEEEGAQGNGMCSPESELGDGGCHPDNLRQLLSEPLRPPPWTPPERDSVAILHGPPQHPVTLTAQFFCRIENIGVASS